MKKWIDEIAADFVNDLIKKSKQPTDMLKAQEVHDYIGSKTSEELAIEMNIKSGIWIELGNMQNKLLILWFVVLFKRS